MPVNLSMQAPVDSAQVDSAQMDSTQMDSTQVDSTPLDPAGRLPDALDLRVVVPTLNDADQLQRLLPQLSRLGVSVVVSDGGSIDNSIDLVLNANVHLVIGAPNRGEQLARGACATSSAWILFLHTDCELSEVAFQQLASVVQHCEPAWGRFDVVLSPSSATLRCISWFMNQRSRLTKICTGDQGIFLHQSLLEQIGGVPCQPLMEDIELSKRLRACGAPFVRLPGPLASSARRWRVHGVLQTVLSMWRYRLRYWLGASPQVLADAYYSNKHEANNQKVKNQNTKNQNTKNPKPETTLI